MGQAVPELQRRHGPPGNGRHPADDGVRRGHRVPEQSRCPSELWVHRCTCRCCFGRVWKLLVFPLLSFLVAE